MAKAVKVVKANPFKTDVENLPFVDFEIESHFTGICEKSLMLGEKEPFKVFVFKEMKTEKRKFVTASYSIDKVISKMITEYGEPALDKIVLNIEYIGKTEVNGKPFNQFNISHCTLDEFNEFYK